MANQDARINNTVLSYLNAERTDSALLLTAPWGTGKSFYIQNILAPFLKRQEKECHIISLYGLKDISEISKAIYLEIRLKSIAKKSEKKAVAKVFGSTIAKGIASFFGVSLDVSEKDLMSLYRSIDLTGKLVVLEDIERCEIDIVSILGFVNGLTERDGCKVLLVANEEEILKTKTSAQHSADYKAIKEKTISDTIYFDGVDTKTISDVVASVNSAILSELIFKPSLNVPAKIIKIMETEGVQSKNLRALIYACQKMKSILPNDGSGYSDRFLERVFLGIVAYSLRKKQNDSLAWSDQFTESSTLGTKEYPLYWFAYLFIERQIVSSDLIDSAYREYNDAETFKRNHEEAQRILSIIYSFSIVTEKELESSLKEMIEKLQSESLFIPFNQYMKLGNYLIGIKELLGFEDVVESCLRVMIANVAKSELQSMEELTSSSGLQLETRHGAEEFSMFQASLQREISTKDGNPYGFDYSREGIAKLSRFTAESFGRFYTERSFASKFDIKRLFGLIKTLSAAEINELRGVFLSVYRIANARDFLSGDIDSLKELKRQIDEYKEEKGHDKVVVLQMGWFASNLDEIIQRLGGSSDV